MVKMIMAALLLVKDDDGCVVAAKMMEMRFLGSDTKYDATQKDLEFMLMKTLEIWGRTNEDLILIMIYDNI